jgi:hypothetical protein
MALIDNRDKRIYYDIEKIKNQINELLSRGYIGDYGNHLPYPTKKGREMFSKLQEAGVNCKLVEFQKDKNHVKIVFNDLLELPTYV